MADSWGTERAGETNVPRFLRDVGSTPAPRKAAIGAQSKSGSFSNHFFSNHFFFITLPFTILKFTTILCHSSQSHQILKIVAGNSFQSVWFFGKVKLSRTPFA